MEHFKAIPVTDPPPADVNVLARTEEMGYWQAKYLPDVENPEYQPEAWEFVGLDGYKPEVLDWVPMPSAPRKPR